ncbi:hypothetical protein VTN31DRAFT_7026 [Thermomyces dupontii]|uniref:uncharacterized protein n=1 Tax=Talaromyces thermophilus TaxID=28565 RepID=UPI003744A2E3
MEDLTILQTSDPDESTHRILRKRSMSPDINSLPPSRSTSASPRQLRNWSYSNSGNGNVGDQSVPQSPSVGPMATNSSGGGDLSHRSSMSRRSSPRSNRLSISESRRRSGIGGYLNVGDTEPPSASSFRTASPSSLGGSSIVGTGDPHHHRAMSLGELHQELEQEQEAQVNRLLHLIRQQQAQLQQLQQQQHQQQQQQQSTSAVEDPATTPSSERAPPSSSSIPPIPIRPVPHRSSRNSSLAASPSLDPAQASVGSEWSMLGDSSAAPQSQSYHHHHHHYQAEAAMLARENQMLRMRVRELERQLSELSAAQAQFQSQQGATNQSESDSQQQQQQQQQSATAQNESGPSSSMATPAETEDKT